MCLKLKREWKRLASSKKVKVHEPTKGEMDLRSVEELLDICPAVIAWCKGFNIGEAYIDGGAQISVMTQACMEKLGLDGSSDFKLRLANHAKVRCLGRCMNIPVTVYGVTCNVYCHIMPAGMGAYPLILGRPWLRQVGAIQNWKEGIITVHNKKGKARQFDMHSRRELEEESEETVTEKEESESSSDQTSSKENSQISFLLEEPDSCVMQMEEIQEKKEESKLEDMDQCTCR